MSETFKYKNLVRSADFNSRYSDIMLPGVLRGFYFEKGTDPFDLTLTYAHEQSSALVMRNGVRIEEVEVLEDVIQVSPNTFSFNRIDNVYAHYIYGSQFAEVSYMVDEGETEQAKELLPDDRYILLGTIELIPGGDLTSAIFTYPTRGIRLPDVANSVVFKEKVILQQGAVIEGKSDTDDEKQIVTQGELRNFVFPYDRISSTNRVGTSGMFENATYYRSDGTKFIESTLADFDEEGKFQKVIVTFYKADGITPDTKASKEIIVVWDEYDNIIDARWF